MEDQLNYGLTIPDSDKWYMNMLCDCLKSYGEAYIVILQDHNGFYYAPELISNNPLFKVKLKGWDEQKEY